jgi:hypothetical protein
MVAMAGAVFDVIAVVYNFEYAVILRRSDYSFHAAGCMSLGFGLFAVRFVGYFGLCGFSSTLVSFLYGVRVLP